VVLHARGVLVNRVGLLSAWASAHSKLAAACFQLFGLPRCRGLGEQGDCRTGRRGESPAAVLDVAGQALLEKRPPSALPAPGPMATSLSVKILVVDDDIDLCTVLSQFLEQNGCTVFSAQDALQASDVLERERVGMVITDLRMPYVSGLRFTEQIKGDPRHKDVPVVMMTANPADPVLEQGLRKGVAMTLAKPFDFDRLLALVRFAE
jgi:two-component system chemotaxis response regulator CheY